MRHPTEGVLRRLLDEPAGVSTTDRTHVADCGQCLQGLAQARRDATAVRTVLATGAAEQVDLGAAWQRLSSATADAPAPVRPAAAARAARRRPALQRPAVAALAFAVVLTGAGTAAANDWLTIFQTKRIAPLSITTADLVALPDLSAYGDLDLGTEPQVRSVNDAASAEELTGLDVPEVDELPGGITGEPIHQVIGELQATFTFSAERAAAAAAASGQALPPPPPGLDGDAVRLDAGPGTAQIWTSASGAPALIVGRAAAPRASSSGVPFETVRDYLLSLPGLPDDVAAQLRTFTADGSVLPLPVPADQVRTSTAEVDGISATVLETRNGALAAVLWVDEGVVTAVAGSLDVDEVLAVARGLG